MQRALRMLLWVIISAGVAVGAVCALVLGVYALMHTDWGRARLVELANDAMSTQDGARVHIERLTGELSSDFEIHGLTVSDRDGTWLRLERAGARWRPSALLGGLLDVARLELHGLAMLRSPVESADSQPAGSPELPLRVRIEHFSLRDAVLEQPVIGDRVGFEASGDTYIEGDGRIRTTVSVERTDGTYGRALAQVVVEPRTQFVDLELTLNEADGGFLARAMSIEGLPAVSLHVDGEGPLDAVRGRAKMRAGDLASVDTGFVLDAGEHPKLEVEGSARVAGLVEPPLRELLSDEIVFNVRAAVTDDGISVERAELSNALAHARFSGALTERSTDLRADVELPSLASFADIAGVPLQGRASIHSNLRSDDFRRGLVADTRATFVDALPADGGLDALAGPEVGISAIVELVVAGESNLLSVRDVRVEGAEVRLLADAKLALATGDLEMSYRVSLPRLEPLSNAVGTPLSGAVEVDGEVTGTLVDPAVTLRLASPDLSVDGVVVGAVGGRLGARRRAGALAGDADVTLDHARIGSLSMASRFRVAAPDRLHLDDLAVRTRDATLAGDLVVDTSTGMLVGRLAGRAPALERWSDLAGRSLSGELEVSIDMREDGRSQRVDLDADARGLTITLEPRQVLAVKSLETSARIEDAFGSARGAIRIAAKRAEFDALRISTLDLDVDVEDARPRSARLAVRGDLDRPFELSTTAGYRGGDGDDFSVEVSELAASLDDFAVTLASPARVTRAGDATALSRTVLAMADGRVTVEGRIDAERIDARLDADALAIGALEPLFATGGMSGTLTGRARVEGTRSDPSGTIDVEASDLRSGHKALAPGIRASARLHGGWRDGRMELDARIAGLAPSDIEARASAPLQLDARTLALSMPADGRIDGELRWTGDLAPVWELFSPFEDRFTGRGNLSVALAGSVAAPRISGFFEVSDGGYVNVLSGTTLSDVALKLVGDGDKLVLESLSAGDGKQGRLQAGGTIRLEPDSDYPTNLGLKFTDFLVVGRDELILVASGDLALEGTLANLLLSGEIVTGQSELLLAGTLPPDVVELEVREVNAANATKAPRKKKPDAGDPAVVVLDLDVSVPGRAFVRGLGLESEWKGDVKISGDAPSPNVAGVLQPVRGNFSLLGKRFELEKGEIRFTGSDEVDPLLNLTAERRASNLTALVEVTGSASRPKIKLTSRPPLPESEIASQVLFGTDSGSLSPAQSLQLASAIATYSGTGGAVGILDSTRRAIGVDVIDFAESKANPDSTRVSVGKYITDGVYLEVEGGTAEDSRTSTTVEVEVLPDVRIEGGTTEKGGNKVGVKWHWDY
ncbi:MAG: translocation/assembly module TamB domain-containing protein [Gammaproteobacteria bacterium]|nr:translocation/assembly module TamB domain-containing protein [Gammaproteobacteria bacterium]